MNDDEQQLRLLSIFHYLVGGLTSLLATFPVIHLVVGLAIATGAFDPSQGGGVPRIFGWLFVAVAATAIVLGWAYAIALVAAGRCLQLRKRRTFCMVVACLSCANVPLGTALGVFTLIVLSRPTARALFDAKPAAVAGPRWDLA